MSKPRLCEILGVEVNQRFAIEGFKDTSCDGIYFVDPDGYFVKEYGPDDLNDCSALCYLIKHPEEIVRSPRWTEKDKTDARAVKELFQDEATIIQRGGDYVYLRSPVETFAAFSKNTFPSLKEGEEMEVDEILGGDNNG